MTTTEEVIALEPVKVQMQRQISSGVAEVLSRSGRAELARTYPSRGLGAHIETSARPDCSRDDDSEVDD